MFPTWLINRWVEFGMTSYMPLSPPTKPTNQTQLIVLNLLTFRLAFLILLVNGLDLGFSHTCYHERLIYSITSRVGISNPTSKRVGFRLVSYLLPWEVNLSVTTGTSYFQFKIFASWCNVHYLVASCPMFNLILVKCKAWLLSSKIALQSWYNIKPSGEWIALLYSRPILYAFIYALKDTVQCRYTLLHWEGFLLPYYSKNMI